MTLDFINKPLTIKSPPDFTVVSTFAGCGGSSTGYVWAGGKVLLAVEWDDNAVATYRANYPGTPIYHGDIAKLSVDDCLRLAGIKVGELDIFDGSPPCQGFSVSGKRMMDDPRNQLFREYVRLLRGLQPKVFVMENVSGMVKGKMKLIFVEILKELKASGYQVSARLLNAKYFGVPQSRERMIFIGVRSDLGITPSHPKAQTIPIPVINIFIGNGKEVPSKSAKRILSSGRHRALEPTQPAPTLLKVSGGLQNDDLYWRQGDVLIEMTPQERKLISSFPSTYKFLGRDKEIANRIGNSVPPRFMQAIAEHIRDHILAKILNTSTHEIEF